MSRWWGRCRNVEIRSGTTKERLALLPVHTGGLKVTASLINLSLSDSAGGQAVQCLLKRLGVVGQLGVGRHDDFADQILQYLA